MKGTAKAGSFTNIKPMAGGVAIAQLAGGDYVYGDLGSTDIMNFSHFYRNGIRVELLVNGVSTLCKAVIGSLTLINEVEPGTPPPPPPPPTTTPFPDYYIMEAPTGERVRYEKKVGQ